MPPEPRSLLSHSRLGRAVHRFLRKDSGARWTTVQSGLNKGTRLLLDPGHGDYMLMWGLHEPEVQAVLPDIVRPGQTAYDLGASVGFFSVALGRLVGPSGHVIAFEPQSHTAIEAVAAENHLPWITVIHRAVADYVGEGVMVDETASLSPVEGRGVRVPVTTIDAFVYDEGFAPPQFVKVDIEGAEGIALAGMTRVAVQYRPTLLIEIHGALGGRQAQAEMVWNWLSDKGYDVLQYTHEQWRKPTGPFSGRCLARASSTPTDQLIRGSA
jgi:FkbM family methyltransferase